MRVLNYIWNRWYICRKRGHHYKLDKSYCHYCHAPWVTLSF